MSRLAFSSTGETRAAGDLGWRLGESPILWLLPIALVLGLFYLAPILDVFRFSLTDATLLGGDERYTTSSLQAVFSNPNLSGVLWTTGIFTVFSVLGQQLIGLAIALLVVRAENRRLHGATALRTLVLIAWVIPGIANGLIWQMLFSEAPFGAINSTLALIGLPRVSWLSDPRIAMVSAIVSNVWRGTAFSMIVLYAALKSIDPVTYEAGRMDGASGAQMLRHITLPLIRPALLVNSILITIQTLNTFDAILSLTGGGPGRATEVISLFTFNTVFRNYDLAAGSVLSVLMLAISLVLTLIYAVFLPRRGEDAT